MKSVSSNKLVILGSVRTYIKFSQSYKFNIGANYVIEFPIESGKNGMDKFKLIGMVFTDDIHQAKLEGIKVLEDFFDRLSIFFNVPIESLSITDSRLERTSGLNIATSERSIQAMGAIAVKDSNMSDFSKMVNSIIRRPILNLFRRCRSEDPYISFWFIYDIMLILIGERFEIDKFLKKNYPELKILHNDYKNEESTIFTAIRDSFNHQTIYSGKPLDIDIEIKSNIDKFRNIAREVVMTKNGIVIK